MSNNPQWKMFQPPESHSSPLHDILDLQHTTMQAKQAYRNGGYSASGEFPSSPRDSFAGGKGGARFPYADACPMGDSAYGARYEPVAHPPIRETGIIEKLLHSYGFIQCCERQARLFFHFSQFGGNTEHLKIGDPVEFEMTYDRRTGKPIASTVTKIAPEVVLSEARVTGTVTTEVKGEGSGDSTGRISYENRGECFFLPYTKDDVEGEVVLRTGDAVSFQIATNRRGTLGACHVRFENPQHPVRYRGVVCSMKENFGFIERADVVKEIFFHFSEAKAEGELTPGDDVEFAIQTRNGKEVACDISRLPAGSVVFEDVSPDTLRGQVLKPLERRAPPPPEPLPGRIRYRDDDHAEVEVPFGDKDQCGEFTLRHGDWVRFQLATDRRDRLKRATNIALLDDSFNVSGERRERGTVCSLRDGFGFIRAADRERAVFFHFAEVLRPGRELAVGDEVEFTVDAGQGYGGAGARAAATRIKPLPPPPPRAPAEPAAAPAPAPAPPPAPAPAPAASPPPERGARARGRSEPERGYIAALKDGFGFIETADHSDEVFFHFSNLEGSPARLELGAEVEYCVGRGAGGGGCASAEWVRAASGARRPAPRCSSPVLAGTVARGLRALNPEQAQYAGLVRSEAGDEYEFGITGLARKRDQLQPGDAVSFRVDAAGRAADIVPQRHKRRATVDAVKGGFGFLVVEEERGRRVFFHMSEVCGGAALAPGDAVECVLVSDARTGKSAACGVVKLRRPPPPPRPARAPAAAAAVRAVRAPRGPDGTRGFRPRPDN